MSFKKKKFNNNEDGPVNEPSSITDLAPIIKEFVDRMRMLDNELENLREQKKDLVEEYSDKLDTKTLNAALKLIQLKEKVQHKDTFDKYTEVLEREIV